MDTFPDWEWMVRKQKAKNKSGSASNMLPSKRKDKVTARAGKILVRKRRSA
jgi:ribosomal protein L27